MYLVWLVFVFLISGCGLETEAPSELQDGDSSGGYPQVERAVYVRKISENQQGTKVQCRLNPLLVDMEEEVPVFIEFEGEEIERKSFKNSKAPVNFKHFNPDLEGELVCVVEWADAEFESEALHLEPQGAKGKKKKDK